MIALRWLSRELAAVSLLLVLLLTLTSLGGRLLAYLGEAAAGELTAATVWALVACRLPEFVQIVAPLAIFLGTLLTFGRAHAEGELHALEAAGRSPATLAAWLTLAALLPALLVACLTTTVTPRAQAALAARLDSAARDAADTLLRPGEFLALGRGRTAWVGSIDARTRVLHDVFIVDGVGAAATPVTVVRAGSAEQRQRVQDGGRFLLLRDGTRWTGRIGAADFQRVRFAQLTWQLPTPSASAPGSAALPTARLWRSTATGTAAPAERAELAWRIALPLGCWLAVPFAIALARGRPRAGRFARVLPGTLAFLAYFASLVLVRTLLARGYPGGLWLAALPHAVIAAAIVAYLWHRHRWAP